MPGAYGYLTAYANSVVDFPNWYAAAGVTRGKIPTLKLANYEISESTSDVMQGLVTKDGNADNYIAAAINPIMQLGSYGYRLFGNRTMAISAA